jgi:hypothetical protein
MSVRPSTWKNLAPTGRIFMKFYIWGFSKIFEKIQFSLTSDKNNRYCTWRSIYIYDDFSPSTEWELFQSCRLNQNSYSTFNNLFFFPKSCRLRDNMEKYGRARQATDGNMALVNFMLDNKDHKHTHTVSNSYCCHRNDGCTNAPHC